MYEMASIGTVKFGGHGEIYYSLKFRALPRLLERNGRIRLDQAYSQS